MKISCFISLFTALAIMYPAYAADEQLKTVGLYSFRPSPECHKFWKACGYTTLQLIDHAFSVPPEDRDAYYTYVAEGIEDAQKAGFKVYIIILSNISSYPDYPNPSVFNPTDRKVMQQRLDDIEIGVKRLRAADGFTFFGGDPGGSPVPLGPNGIKAWENMGRKVHNMVKMHSPKAEFNVNIWAVTAWEDISISAFKVDFWIKEVEYGKMIAAEKNFVGPDSGIEFPLHNYYRSLTFKAYVDAGKTPELYPVSSDVKALKDRGTPRMWGWAHFLIDEVDDGYTGYSGLKSHPAQAETRYLHRIVSDARRIGLNGIVSNTDGANTKMEAINTYAFARFCKDPSAEPGQVIDEYCAFLADKSTRHSLGQVMRFIENYSTWEMSIPESYRLKSFDCEYKTAAEALAAIEKVKPNRRPGFVLPEPPAKYIQRLKERLQDIVTQESGTK